MEEKPPQESWGTIKEIINRRRTVRPTSPGEGNGVRVFGGQRSRAPRSLAKLSSHSNQHAGQAMKVGGVKKESTYVGPKAAALPVGLGRARRAGRKVQIDREGGGPDRVGVVRPLFTVATKKKMEKSKRSSKEPARFERNPLISTSEPRNKKVRVRQFKRAGGLRYTKNNSARGDQNMGGNSPFTKQKAKLAKQQKRPCGKTGGGREKKKKKKKKR